MQQLSVTVTINVTITEVIDMTTKIVSPQVVQAGDHVLDKSHQVMVTHIEGPDHAGVYDFFGINEQGQGQIVSVQEFVHLLR